MTDAPATVWDDAPAIGLARWWWAFVVRGLVAIAVGGLFLVPGIGIELLVAAFAAWVIVDGASSLLAGLRTRGQDRSWWLEVVEGLIGIAAGVAAILLPQFAIQAIVFVVAAWAVLTGVVEVVLAVRLRRVLRGEAWMALSGVTSILLGVLLVSFPAAGALGIAWLIGAGAIVFGVFEVALGWRLRGLEARRAGAQPA